MNQEQIDERDALAHVLHAEFEACRGRNGVSPKLLADKVLAAGFHRAPESVVVETVEGPARVLYGDDLRMDAYYYSFSATGNREIDAILSAVAWAGKAAHNTESWLEPSEFGYGPMAPGQHPVDVIQRAAERAATVLTATPAKVEVSAEQVEAGAKAARLAFPLTDTSIPWDQAHEVTRESWLAVARDTLRAAGIEVSE